MSSVTGGCFPTSSALIPRTPTSSLPSVQSLSITAGGELHSSRKGRTSSLRQVSLELSPFSDSVLPFGDNHQARREEGGGGGGGFEVFDRTT